MSHNLSNKTKEKINSLGKNLVLEIVQLNFIITKSEEEKRGNVLNDNFELILLLNSDS